MTHTDASQSQRQESPVIGTGKVTKAAGTRICDFLNLNPPLFTGSDPNKDTHYFIDQIQYILDVMHVSGTEAIELVTYRLKGMAIL